MSRTLRSVGLSLSMAFLLCPGLLRAQAVGEILGMVTDPSDAVVPDAKITALQPATGLTRTTVTTAAGNYSLPNLPVGTYTVTAEAQGFQVASTKGITLDVNQQREVNFTVALPGATTQVQVTAAPPLLTTTNATLEGLVNGQQVNTLPLNGRDITGLMMLQPGVNIEVDSSLPITSNPSGNNFVASNGNRGTTGASYMDGLDTSDNEFGGTQFTNFNLDAIAEFKIIQNNYSAEFGRGAGTIVQLVSKSGTNQLHGSAFEYLRNDVLDARNFFAIGVPPFKRNEFGGTIGGPIDIPHVYNGKDRTFFFFQYAGFRQRLGEPVLIPVPTAQERQGIVDITGSNGNPDQLLVPLDPVAKTILDSYPLPNQPNGALGPRTLNFQFSVPLTTNQWSSRVDHRFSDKDSLFVRLTNVNNELPVLSPAVAVIDPTFSAQLANRQTNHGFSATHVFTPTLLQTFRFAYQRTDVPWTERNTQVAQMQFTDGSLATWGTDTGEFSDFNEGFIFSDSVSWIKGRHTINAGGEYRRIRDNGVTIASAPTGSYFFGPGHDLPVPVPSASGNNDLPAGAPSPSSLISFMTGVPDAYSRGVIFPRFPTDDGILAQAWRRWHLAGWIQDDIKASRRLTLNLGLRYEYNSVPYEQSSRSQGIVDDPNFQGGKLYRMLVIHPKPLYFPDYNGWGPRFGLAYKLTEGTVFRGGFGIFTNLPLTQTADQQIIGSELGVTNNPPFSMGPISVPGVPELVDMQGNLVIPPDGNTKKIPANTPLDLQPIANFLGGPVLVDLADMHFKNGYTMAGNVTLERQLPGDMVLQAGYVTNNAVKLYASEFPNAYSGALPQFTPYSLANPGLGEFQLTDNHAHSTYNSLQVMLRKASPSHGIQFQASYTYSKAIDNATTVFNGPAAESSLLQNNPFCWACEKSVSAFDFPHRLVVNFVYALPLDHWNAVSFAPRRLVQGWQITSIFDAQSGFPFTVTSPYGTREYGTDVYIGFQATRPDLVQQATLKTGGGPEEQFFSDAVINNQSNYFATPGAVTTGLQDHPGNLGRNTFRTHPFSNTDFSIIKDTTITEGKTLQFRAEFFNVFNQHAFNIPGSVLGSPGFGVAGSTIQTERQIQFALKFTF